MATWEGPAADAPVLTESELWAAAYRLASGTDVPPAKMQTVIRRVLNGEPALSCLLEAGAFGEEVAELTAFFEGREVPEE